MDGGARHAASDLAQASCEPSVAAYRQTALIALQEVEDHFADALPTRTASPS